MTATAPIGGVWAMKNGDFQPTNFASTGDGIAGAMAYVGSSGGEVYIGPGTYNPTAPLTLRSGMRVRGAGIGVTIIKWPNGYAANNNDSLLTATSATTHVRIEDLTLDGNRTNLSTSNSLFGVRMIDPSFLTIRRIRCTEHHNGGIRLLNSAGSITDSVIEDCIVDGYGTAGLFSTIGISIESSTDTVSNQRNTIRDCMVRDATVASNARGIILESNRSRIAGCTVQNMQTNPNSDDVAGISLNKCTSSQATGNSVDSCYGTAYSCQNGRTAGGDTTFVNQSNSFVGNSATTCRFGLEASGPSNLTVTGNSLSLTLGKVGGGAAEGIEINDDSVASGTLDNISVTGNTVDQAQGNAIWIGSGSSGAATMRNVVVTGNTIFSCKQIGIHLSENVEGANISDNTLYACGQDSNNSYACIDIGAGVASKTIRYVSISGNIVRNAAASPRPSYGILVRKDVDFVLVCNNYIAQCWNNAILLSGAAGQTNQSTVCTGNIVDFAQTDAVSVSYLTDAVISGNIVKNGGGAGGGYSGILLDNSTGVVAFGNRCTDDDATTAMSYGVKITGTTTAVLGNSDFTGTATGDFNTGTATWRDVASVAGTITLPSGTFFNITGTNTITSITASYPDRHVFLKFASTAGLTDGSNLKLSANFSGTADDVVHLACDGTNWYEVARSAN